MTKLRTYDSRALSASYVIAAQFVQKINELMIESEIDDLTKLPPSILSTEELYNMAVCNVVMYDTLTDHSLLASGHAKQSKTIH